MEVLLVLLVFAPRAPFEHDLAFAIYFILSAFTFTRLAGIRATPNDSVEQRVRIAFYLKTEREQLIGVAQLARLLCPSGVIMTEVEKSFAELKALDGADASTLEQFRMGDLVQAVKDGDVEVHQLGVVASSST